jgi:hypothetical protein
MAILESPHWEVISPDMRTLLACDTVGKRLCNSHIGRYAPTGGGTHPGAEYRGGDRRIREYVTSWEEAQVRKSANLSTFVGKILIIEREWVNGRTTVILVRQPIGI